MRIEWDEPQPSVGDILNYTVKWTNVEINIISLGNASESPYHIKHLVPYSNYSVQVQALTKAGAGKWSESNTFRTAEGVPSAPQNLKISDITNTSIHIEWDEPQSPAGDILNYTVEWTNVENGNIDRSNASESPYHIKQLVPYSNYSVRVQAVTKAGPGNWSEIKTFRTAEGVPLSPPKPEIVNVTDSTIIIKWSEPLPSRGPVLDYTVETINKNTSNEKQYTTENVNFVIKELNAYTDYSIRVRGRTAAGNGSWSEELLIRTKSGVPSTPLNPKAKDCTNTSILIQWEEPKPFRGPILSYTVKWTNLIGKWSDRRVKDSTEFNITDLEPFDNYTIHVRATTDAGDGEWSQTLNVRTKIGVPLKPLNVRDKHVKNTSIEIQWDEPTPNRGPIDNYTVMWTKSNTKESKTRIAEPQSNTGFVIDDLQPFTDYIIRIRATTEAGDGPWSSEHQTQTGIGVPWPPQNVRSKEKTNCTIHLVWEEPQPTTGPILSYILKWTNVNSKISNTTDMNGNITSYVIEKLEPFTDYNIQMLARTEAGEGKWSDKVVIRTEIGIPTTPRDVKLSVVTNTTIELEWNIPNPSNGPIEFYMVQWTNLKSNNSAEMTTKDLFYKIDNLSPYTEYSIQICARTSAGEGSWSKQLITQTKIGISSPPRNVSVLEKTAFVIKLSWDIPEYPNSPVSDLKYLVSCNAAGKETITSDVEKPPFHAVNLTAYTEYIFLIFAQTEVGLSLSSDPLTVRTSISEPSVPQNLSVVNVTSTTILIEWSIPEYPNGPELTYDLQWMKEDDHTRKGNKTNDTHYEVKELEPYTDYSVQVRARKKKPFTESLLISTEIAIPESAKIEAFTRTSRTILVQWNKTGPFPGPVSYFLEVWQMPTQCNSKSETFPVRTLQSNEDRESWKTQRDVIVEDLIPYTSYFFRVKLATKVGSKTSESSNIIKTPADVPDAPQNVKAECNQQPTEAEVSWSPPKYPNGLIVKYRIEYGLENSYKKNAYLTVSDPCKEQKISLQNLRPERHYTITVRARVQGVDSDGHPATFKPCILPAGIPPLGNTSKILVKESGPHRLMIEWSRDAFSDYMGALVRYAVLVGLTDALGNATSGKTSENLPNWSKFIEGESNYYQATPPEWNPFDKSQNDSLECKPNTDGSILKCTIGLESYCPNNETYCNGPLRPATQYEMKLRAFTRGGYAESQPLLARTAPAPSSSYLGALAAGLTLLFIVIFLLMGLMVLQRKGKLEPLRQVIRSRFGHTAPSAPPIPEPPQQIEIYQTRGPLDVHNFSEHVRIMMSDSHLRFSQEFEALKRSSPQFPCATAEMEENRGKNRWMNIYPYDHSRVKLLPLGDEPGSDFVNANYIPGNSSLREYIASQGPLPNTVDDFWRMIWEQSVTVIVMLTQCVERGKNKCEQYWPAPGEMKYYGDLQVRTLSESMLSSYVIRVFHVQLGPRELRVKQMHFTRWPDFGCPESPDDLINFVRAVRDHLPRVRPGPILVHCSAGVGRTGTFIAVDRLSQQLMRSDVIDVYGTVLDLRQYRTNMVQTEDQYIYIHLCVNQLIRERATADEDEYEEAIYSNVGAMKDTGV
ncbi:Phosphotidylinositol phosphatase PTPRQ, partial [Stegodyphus mimosarum]